MVRGLSASSIKFHATFYVVIQIFYELLFHKFPIAYLCIRELKRKQALLGSNLSAIDFLRYIVTLLRGGRQLPSLFYRNRIIAKKTLKYRTIKTAFYDVDKFGHVNNTVYFSFYDLRKTEYFASVCPDVDWEKDGIVVVHIEANFLAQIYGSDYIVVQTAITEIGTKSFHLAQRVIDTGTQKVKCVCTSVMAAFDLAKHESKPLEEEWIEAICKYEGKDLKKKK